MSASAARRRRTQGKLLPKSLRVRRMKPVRGKPLPTSTAFTKNAKTAQQRHETENSKYQGAYPARAWNGAVTASWWDFLAMFAYLGWGIGGLFAGGYAAHWLPRLSRSSTT
jgi:hypothetical protein